MTSVNCGIRYGFPWLPNTTPTPSAATLSTSTTGYAASFFARDTNPIIALGFQYTGRAGTPPSYIASIQGVNSSNGNPDGTIKGGGSPASVVFTPPASSAWDNTWQWVTLDNPYTPSYGEELMFDIRYSSGTVNGSNYGSFGRYISVAGDEIVSDPASLFTGNLSTWSKTAGIPVFGVKTASSRYGNIFKTAYATRSASTVGHRVALKFTMPSIWTSCNFRNVKICGSIATTTGKSPLLKVWDENNNVVQSETLNSNYYTSPGTNYQTLKRMFSALVPITPGLVYRCGYQVADATSGSVLINGIQFAEAADRDSWGDGLNMCLSTYDGSSWTDDDTVLPFVNFGIDSVTASSGSSGNYVIGG